MFLHEWCQKQKRPVPKYTPREQEEGAWGCKVVMRDPKNDDKSIVCFVDRDAPCATKEDAIQAAAVVGLHRVAGERALHRVLPKEYLPLWDALHAKAEKRQMKQEKREKYEEIDRKRKARDLEAFNQMPEVHLSEENRKLVKSLVLAAANQHQGKDAPDAGNNEGRGTSKELLAAVERFAELGFAERDAKRAVEVNGTDYDGGLEWLCLHVEEGMLPKRFAPLASPVTILASAEASAGENEDEKALVGYGYDVKDVREALSQADESAERAFVSLYYKHVLGKAIGELASQQRGKGSPPPPSPSAPSSLSPSPEWLEEQEVLEAIYMDDFVVGKTEGSMAICCPIHDERHGKARTCTVEFLHPPPGEGSSPYPHTPPLMRMQIAEIDPGILLTMTRLVATHAQAMKGESMIHDLLLYLPEAFTQATKDWEKTKANKIRLLTNADASKQAGAKGSADVSERARRIYVPRPICHVKGEHHECVRQCVSILGVTPYTWHNIMTCGITF